ncbi:hypothetical protein C448_01309 [Halococcus morrhuae DSM 1307]|uniref:Uncharacterized protein n=1 Tax=Halococcus morrhuae DSM 1307 TaxID=931277 RepID=M0N0B9_HALMO|nr:hypothetical protein [Halococcus morrhuae]EMA50514.1 hypothetical protein C448_01309 [Halococcus morrhuae DSM 1307]
MDGFTSESGPFLDDGVAEVPTAQDDPEIQLTERVRAGDVPVVVDRGDVVLDALFDLAASFLRRDDAGFGRRGKRVLA